MYMCDLVLIVIIYLKMVLKSVTAIPLYLLLQTGVPPSLLQSLQSVRQRGGMPHLQTLREQLKSSSQQAIQMSIEIRTMLQVLTNLFYVDCILVFWWFGN